MSVVGIDLGTQNTVIAVARNRGVDVIVNETSNRATPSLVGFNRKSRELGEPAKSQEIRNFKNIVASFSRIAGRAFNDPDVQNEQKYITVPFVDIGGQVGVEVTYLGKKERFTATQIVAMFLTKLKDTAYADTKNSNFDLVLSCPAWYTDSQRRALIDACDIAGMKLLRIINETTASALGYGITKTDLPAPEEKPRRVAFVDIGHSNYTCSIVEFRKGELTVKSTAWDRNFGGRNFEQAIVDHFAKEFKDTYKIDINESPKNRLRVAAECVRLKKILSANAFGQVQAEVEERDVKGTLKREQFEELVKPLLEKATIPIEQALADAKLKVEDIDGVEMVGGCTRIPALKTAIQNFFGKQLSFTLNQDEAVARGAAFACAILSPVFRVRDFSIHDVVSYPIEFAWEKSPDIPDEDTNLTVFNKGNTMPSTKILTFYRKQPFSLEAKYAKPEGLPGKLNPWIGNFTVKGVQADSKDDFMICKLKARLNLNGVLNVEQGYYVEDQEVEEPIPEPKEGEKTAEGDKMDTDEKPKTRKVRKQVRKGDLPLAAQTASLDAQTKAALQERENEMTMEDKLVALTDQAKNDLEGYVYETRDKLDGVYKEFIANSAEKEKVEATLDAIQDWLDDEGEDTTKVKYTDRLEEINRVIGPIKQRLYEKQEAERQAKIKAQEEAAAAKRAEEEAKKAAEQPPAKDEEMKDADGETVQPTEVEEPEK